MSAPEQSDEAPVRRPRRELVEAEIYEQATRLFAERGFAGTSLQDIADAMGMTRPSLYYYVKNKDELLARLVTEITEGRRRPPREEIAGRDLDAAAKLRELVQLHRRAAGRATRRGSGWSSAPSPSCPPTSPSPTRSRSAGARRRSRAIVDQGVRSGEFRPRPVADDRARR